MLLALVGRHAGWELLGHQLWWIWVVVAFPYLLLAAVLLLAGWPGWSSTIIDARS